MSGCLIKLDECLKTLRPSERKVAEYILDFSAETVEMSIGELAERSGSSVSAVVRLCKTIGYSGYREFLRQLAADVGAQKAENNIYTDIRAGDDLKLIIENVSHNNKKSIEDSLLVISYEAVEKAVDALRKARRVDFYGVGASGVVAFDAMQKFTRIGKFAAAYADPHLQVMAASTLSSQDVAVVISYSGETKDIIESMKIAKQSGATVISLTKYGRNPLNEGADIALMISSTETSMRIGAMGSRIAQLNVIDILYTGVASLEYDNIKDFINRTHRVTAIKKTY